MLHSLLCGIVAFTTSLAIAFLVGAFVWAMPDGDDARPARAAFCLFAVPARIAIAVFAGNLASRIP